MLYCDVVHTGERMGAQCMQHHVGCGEPAAGGRAWLLVYFVGCMHTPSTVRRQDG